MDNSNAVHLLLATYFKQGRKPEVSAVVQETFVVAAAMHQSLQNASRNRNAANLNAVQLYGQYLLQVARVTTYAPSNDQPASLQ